MDVFERCTWVYLQVIGHVTGALPLRRFAAITLAVRVGWATWFVAHMTLTVRLRIASTDVSLGGLVGSALTVSDWLALLVSITEMAANHRQYMKIADLQRELDVLIERHLRIKVALHRRRVRPKRRVFWLLVFLYSCDALKTYVHLKWPISTHFWLSIIIRLQCIRVLFILIILVVMEANERLTLLQRSVLALGVHNKPRSKYGSDIWMPYAVWEYDQLDAMRLIYGRLYAIYASINDCFGCTILALFLTSFFAFVCNAFWCYMIISQRLSTSRFIYDVATMTSIGSLVSTLAINSNIAQNMTAIMAATRRTSKLPAMAWKWRLYSATGFCIRSCAKVVAVAPIAGWPLLGELLAACWLVEILVMTGYAIVNEIARNAFSLGGLVNAISYLAQMLAHLTVVLESAFVGAKHLRADRRLRDIAERMTAAQFCTAAERDALFVGCSGLTLAIAAVLALCHATISWTTFETQSIGGIYWYSLPTAIVLNAKMLTFLAAAAIFKGMLDALLRHINELGERNLSEIMPPQSRAVRASPSHAIKPQFCMVAPRDMMEDDLRQLAALKAVHSDIFVAFRLINDYFGWSLLAMTAVYFIDFVCNAYWIIKALLRQGTGRDSFALLQNICFVLIAVVLLSILCFTCQRINDHSRHIGCLIFKLVKPLGNKRYNELVREFSLQTLHQRFVITAKQFFIVDVNLLGAMVAAIVTYLVILIQFMFTENMPPQHAAVPSTTAAPANITAATV